MILSTWPRLGADIQGTWIYEFSSLSFGDFEGLARDLIGYWLGVRFEAFPEGPDDGIDGRHAAADGDVSRLIRLPY